MKIQGISTYTYKKLQLLGNFTTSKDNKVMSKNPYI